MGGKSSKSISRRSVDPCTFQRYSYINCVSQKTIYKNAVYSLQATVKKLQNEYSYKQRRQKFLEEEIKKLEIEIRKLRDSYDVLKSVCMSADANTKKNKKEQLKMLSGRYLDRINLLEAQKNVLNKQASLLSSKIDQSDDNKIDIDTLDNTLATKSRMTLYSKNISSKNTRIIWFLKIIAYILCILLVFIIMNKL